ncbi:hypothetical protein [Methylobacterium sp. 77]|uniref:hypothetical protein n=1 Tax=Methylobacterium sp. 77 TaxID=1101192 RepID=UPI00036E1820|nr:hypothetical protein [Methylobacterium sp. 77]
MRILTILPLLGAMAAVQPAMASEPLSLRVAKAAIKRDSQAPNGATARLILDAESGRRLAVLANKNSGRLATLAIDGQEIERQRVTPAFTSGELSLNGLPLSKAGSTVVRLIQGKADLTIRIDPATTAR